MNARGRVVNDNTGVIHKMSCQYAISIYTRPLSEIPAPKRRSLSKCKVCKP